MCDLFRLLPLRNLGRQWLRSALTVVGAACGVALFVAIEIIDASTLRYFADGVRSMAGGAALTVTASEAGFAASEGERLRTLAGVRAIVPSIEVVAHVLPGNEWEPELLALLGIDPELEPLARTHRLEGALFDPRALDVVLDANTVLLPPSYAEGQAGAPGSRIRVAGQSGVEWLRVAGRLASTSGNPEGQALASLATAQHVFGFENRVTRLDLVVDEARDVDALAREVREVLGPAFTVESARARELDIERMVRVYQVLLRFLAGLTLAAGALVVAATLGISVREQAQSIGVLRALGASRARLLALVVGEAAMLAAVGSALGVCAGRLAADGLVGAVTRTLANTYMVPISPATLQYSASDAVLHGFAAWVVGAGAALATAVRAARVEPAEAIRSPGIRMDVGVPPWLVALGVAGVCAALYLAVVATAGWDRSARAWQSFNAGLGVIAAIALAPALVIGVLRVAWPTRFVRRLLDRRVVLRLGAGNVLRAPGRSAWRALLLSVGLLMFVTVDTLHQSLLLSVEGWIDRTVYSDLLVASPGRLFLMEVQPLDEALGRDIDAVPGIRIEQGRGAMAIRFARVRHAGRDITVKAFDRPHASLPRLPFDFRADWPLVRGGDIFADPPAALVSENFVRHFGIRPGDPLTLDSPTGPVNLEVLGVVTDFASPVGVVYLPRDLYRARWRDRLVSVFSVLVAPGESPARVADAIESTLGSKGLHATNQRELRRQTREILAESFAYTTALEAAALVAAILGIMNSMVASVVASRRELALLRALGMPQPALAWTVISEGLAIGIPSSLAAVALGLLLAALCLADLGSALMGWTLEFHASAATVAITLVLGTASGAAASALAAWKAGRLPVADGLAAY